MTANKLDIIIQKMHAYMQYIPHLFVVVCPIFSVLPLIMGRIDLFTRASLILIPLWLTSIFLIISRNKKFTPLSNSGWTLNLPNKSLTKLYIISTILLLTWIILDNGGLIQLILFGISYAIIILQIVSTDTSEKMVLLELCITTMLLILPRMLLSGLYYGDGDLLAHISYATEIASLGQLLTNQIAGSYANFFSYHLSSAMTGIFLNIEINKAMYLLTATIIVSAFPVIYLLTYRFTNSKRAALFAVFFYSTTNIISNEYLMPAPRAILSVTFIFILYLLFSHITKNKLMILSSIICVFMILTHHAQLIVVLITIPILCLGSIIYKRKFTIGNGIVLIICTSFTILYLMYSYLSNVIHLVNFRVVDSVDKEIVLNTIITTDTTLYMSPTSFLMFISVPVMVIFIMIGLYLLITKVSKKSDIIILLPFTLLLFVVIVPWVLDIVPFIADNLQLYRFRLILIPIFSIIMGFGCVSFLNIIQSHNVKKHLGTYIVVMLCVTCVCSTPIIAMQSDNDAFSNIQWIEHSVYSFDNPDKDLLIFIIDHVSSEKLLGSDTFYSGYISRFKPEIQTSSSIGHMFLSDKQVSSLDYIIFPAHRYYDNKYNIRVDAKKKEESVESTHTVISTTNEYDNNFNNNIHYLNSIYDSKINQIIMNR